MTPCPRCGSDQVHHSRVRSGAERLRRRLTRQVPFRCHACDWRGWRRDPPVSSGEKPPSFQRELTDAELDTLDSRGPEGERT